MIKPCKNCGDTTVLVNDFVSGWFNRLYDKNGEIYHTSMDNLGGRSSRTYRCGNCQKIRRDVIRMNGRIYNIGATIP